MSHMLIPGFKNYDMHLPELWPELGWSFPWYFNKVHNICLSGSHSMLDHLRPVIFRTPLKLFLGIL